MNPPNQLTFTLKQHTPLIHFQHEQDGATLRATELKPALDKYLLEKAFNNDFQSCERFLISPNKFMDGNKGFNYKIHFDYSKATIWTSPIEKHFPCYFGNMGDGAAKAFSFAEGFIDILIISNHKSLLELLKTHIIGFFERKNFGTRQSKGFGSFLIENQVITRGINKYWFKVNGLNVSQKNRIVSDFRNRNKNIEILSDEVIFKTESYKMLFKNIELIWRVIRTGYNDGKGNYIKAPLFFYMKKHFKENESFQWDKRSIKQTYLSEYEINQQKNKHDYPDILELIPKPSNLRNNLLVRDLFGLATESKWMSYNNVTLKKVHLKEENDDEIERFKSPITFKPKWNEKEQKFEVYIFLSPIDKKFLGKFFKINWGNNSRLILDTPQEFSLSKYFKYLTDEYKEKLMDLDDNIINGNTDYGDLAKVITIFKSLRDYNKLTNP